ncbi:FAD dependent oxidoreductase [Wilcoxina mikolae CBS 423.85]|nr:FAD dependent oxidoreductase [Wilcoxina mikolae CBS 423.85]
MAASIFKRNLSTFRQNDFTHCIIGAGVIGLSIARHLSKSHPNTSTLLLERHSAVGTETSSRNSEVIHNGTYYPAGSLKTHLCIKGRHMLYEYCQKHYIPHKKTGKWIVAQTPEQLAALEGVYKHGRAHGIPLNWLSPKETATREPNVRALAGALESPETGIVDSHALMQSLLGEFVEAGGDVSLGTRVTSVSPLGEGGGGYKIATKSGEEEVEVTADVVVNAAGLEAVGIGNMLLPKERHRKAYYCRGTYYVPLSRPPPVGTLIYPAPIPGFGGLGTHLTMDMGGNFRFGPDVEWVDDPSDVTATEAGMAEAKVAIETYLPGIGELRPDYAGIRPKLKPQHEGGVAKVDFWIKEEDGHKGFVNLLGIESPGLTSSLAIAEYVDGILYK